MEHFLVLGVESEKTMKQKRWKLTAYALTPYFVILILYDIKCKLL